MKAINLLTLLTTVVTAVDYSENGINWTDDTCITGKKQSPINIETHAAVQNSKVKFTIDYMAIDTATLQLADQRNKLFVDYSNFSKSYALDFWNERGERFKYYLDYVQWKVGSEHTIDNRQFSAELQIIHKQFATNRKVVISILFDEEIFIKASPKEKQKTCFVESFSFTNYTNRKNDLEIPLREYLNYIP
jgi:carbonic anhydrase